MKGEAAPKAPDWVLDLNIAKQYGWTMQYIEEELPAIWRSRIAWYNNIQDQVESSHRNKS